MQYVFIGFALAMLCLPFTVRSKSLAVMEGNFFVQNLKFGPLPYVSIKIELEEGRFLLCYGQKKRRIGSKKETPAESGKEAAEEVKRKFIMPIDKKMLSSLRLKEFSVTGSFGCQNAAATALVCTISVIIINVFYNTLPPAEKFNVNIVPDYGKASLKLNLTASLQINLLLIFYWTFAILFKNFLWRKK